MLSRRRCSRESLLTPSALREIDDLVKMGVKALGERATGLHLLAIFLHKTLKVLLRSPLCIVDDAGTVCASVQRRPDHAGLIWDRLDKANPLIDDFLLLFRFCLKDIDQGHQITLAGNTHFFPPLEVFLSGFDSARLAQCL